LFANIGYLNEILTELVDVVSLVLLWID